MAKSPSCNRRLLARGGYRALLWSALLWAGVVSAGPGAVEEASDSAIRSRLQSINAGIEVRQIIPTPLPSLYEVISGAGDVFYMSADGKYLLHGEMLQLDGQNGRNLTAQTRQRLAKEALARIASEDTVVFPAVEQTRAVLYAFTDVDCGYCAKLHKEIPYLNDNGVEVRYLAFPRGGRKAPAFAKMVTAWCSKDRQQALEALKRGESLSPQTCDNPVESQYQLGLALGVRGTPTLFTEEGVAIRGYRSAEDLLKMLNLEKT